MQNQQNSELVLIMKGGGIKGLAYVGALEILEHHYKFDWYAGTSAGAIAASLLASGYSTEELKKILGEKDFNQFKDAGFFRKFGNLITKGGLYEAFTFKEWLNELLGEKLDKGFQIKLRHLHFRVTIYASKRNQSAIVFDSNTRPEVPVSHAARSSMSIPFIFTPEREYGLNVFDGGLQNNYPVKQIIELADDKVDFIGFYLGPERFEEKKTSTNIIGIFRELISIWTEAVDYENLEKYEEKTVIIDPRPISTLKFKLNDIEKEFLLECGRVSAIKFLKKKGKIANGHNYLLNFDDRIKGLEKKREELTRNYRKFKIKKRVVSLLIFSLVVLSGFIGFNKERRDCMVDGISGKANLGVSGQFNPLECLFNHQQKIEIPVNPDTVTSNTKIGSLLSIQNASIEEGGVLSFPITIKRKYPKNINLNFSINHIDTKNEDFDNTEYSTTIPSNSLEATLKIPTKKDPSKKDKKFSLKLKSPDTLKMDKTPIGIIQNINTPHTPPIVKSAFIKGKIIDAQGISIANAHISYQNLSAMTNSNGFFELKIPEKVCNDKSIEITVKKDNISISKAVRLCREDLDIQL